MKKLILLAAITLMLGGIVNAQSSDNVVKGIHGGIVFGSEDLKFEFVEKGSDVSIYPMSADGSILKAVPTSADLTIVLVATKMVQDFKNVPFENGCFKVTRSDVEVPLYLVGVSTSLNEKHYDAKYKSATAQVK